MADIGHHNSGESGCEAVTLDDGREPLEPTIN